MDPREKNAAMNRFMREKEAQEIGSPFRRNVYARARLKGKTPEQASYRLLGLTYDSEGRGYWTRGLARLRQMGLEPPKPPRRYPLPMLVLS